MRRTGFTGSVVSHSWNCNTFAVAAIVLSFPFGVLLALGRRSDLPVIRNNDDLATVINQFSAHDVSRLPVGLPGNTSRVIGLISRAALMRRYQMALAG